MSKKFYTRKEAADILGVHPQSVSNYAAKGLLHEVRSGNYVKFIKEEVDALSTIPAIHSYEEILAKAEEVEAKELELLANMTRRLEERTAEFKDLFTNGHPERWYRYRELVLQVVRLAADEALKQNEKEILWSVLELDTLQEVADRFRLTRERIRQVFEKPSAMSSISVISPHRDTRPQTRLSRTSRRKSPGCGHKSWRLSIRNLENPQPRLSPSWRSSETPIRSTKNSRISGFLFVLSTVCGPAKLRPSASSWRLR